MSQKANNESFIHNIIFSQSIKHLNYNEKSNFNFSKLINYKNFQCTYLDISFLF